MNTTGKLQVKDMPDALSDACTERGWDATHEMTMRQALKEWAAWELGDEGWASTMLDLCEEFQTDLREQT